MQVNNDEFLRTVFGDDYIWAHVTGFPDDPSNISDKRHRKCWQGGYYRDAQLVKGQNQYFTISTFYCDHEQKARRRKALFRQTHVIVADDVKEKIPFEQVIKLPPPSYKLQTSPGSEQWGWILSTPCTDRAKVDNLLDGLVAKGLAPSGKDPGMKGTTRYVRLPEGANTKASRVAANGGTPPPCVLLEWRPERRYSMETLASVFAIDLTAARREFSIDGATLVDDHPLLELVDLVQIKEIRSPGRYDITCPWVENHTGQADDGAAVFTNADGTIGFKCHHGSCQDKTGKHLLDLIERSQPGFRQRLSAWQALRAFDAITGGTTPLPKPLPGLAPGVPSAPPAPSAAALVEPPIINQMPTYQTLVDQVRSMVPNLSETMQFAYKVLLALEEADHGTRVMYQEQVREHFRWSKTDVQKIIEEQRRLLRPEKSSDLSFYDDFIYIAATNAFCDPAKDLYFTPEAFGNKFAHLDEDCRATALVRGKCRKVDKINFAPGKTQIYIDSSGAEILNTWTPIEIPQGNNGSVQWWWEQFDLMGWAEHRKHILQWMAYTLRYPEVKINHGLLFAGGEGIGKDWLLMPLAKALGRNARVEDGVKLLGDFNEFLMGTKLLQVNETEHGDHKDASRVYNAVKPLFAAPPATLAINIKGVRRVEIDNIVNVVMTSNSAAPLRLAQDSRRVYACWSDLNMRDARGQLLPMWKSYWQTRWQWMRDQQGWKDCANYLYHHVDLSDFDPGAVPDVTDFVREMRQIAEDPIAATLRELIERRLSLMAADLITAKDAYAAVRHCGPLGLCNELRHVPSANVLGKVLRQNGLGVLKTVKFIKDDGRRTDTQIWIIRNREYYEQMGQTELGVEYARQHALIANATPLTVIPGGLHGAEKESAG